MTLIHLLHHLLTRFYKYTWQLSVGPQHSGIEANFTKQIETMKFTAKGLLLELLKISIKSEVTYKMLETKYCSRNVIETLLLKKMVRAAVQGKAIKSGKVTTEML